ncbi:MAG: hypothetical protein MUE56_06785, partial [Ignavibacteria bacterium]|nr:hypothetical protein [Ignavibacteria bacterium]
MKKIIVLVFLFLASVNISFSQIPSVTKTIKIYDTDSASVWKFYKTKLPQTGYKNLYIQLSGVYQGYNVDLRYGNIYRLNYQTNIFSDMYHNGFLHNSYDLIPPYGILIGYAYDFNISPLDTNLLIKGGCSAWWEPMEGATFTINNGDTAKVIMPSSMTFFITVAIDPTNDSIMYAGLKSGIIQENFYKTTNRGTNWFSTDTLINYAKSRTYVNPFNHNIVFLMNSSLYRSTTGGYDFSVLTTGTSYEGRMLFDAYDNTIYLISPSTEGIRKSTNNGNTWSQVFNKPSNDLEIDPLNYNIFYAGTGEGIYKSTNKGVNWFLYNNTFTPSKNILGIIKNPNSA